MRDFLEPQIQTTYESSKHFSSWGASDLVRFLLRYSIPYLSLKYDFQAGFYKQEGKLVLTRINFVAGIGKLNCGMGKKQLKGLFDKDLRVDAEHFPGPENSFGHQPQINLWASGAARSRRTSVRLEAIAEDDTAFNRPGYAEKKRQEKAREVSIWKKIHHFISLPFHRPQNASKDHFYI